MTSGRLALRGGLGVIVGGRILVIRIVAAAIRAGVVGIVLVVSGRIVVSRGIIIFGGGILVVRGGLLVAGVGVGVVVIAPAGRRRLAIVQVGDGDEHAGVIGGALIEDVAQLGVLEHHKVERATDGVTGAHVRAFEG